MIYAESLRGSQSENNDSFFSCSCSHYPFIVEHYVATGAKWMATLGGRPDFVDLRCGDFVVGAKLRRFCGNYIACDAVESLIARNRERCNALNVDFRVIDLTADTLPYGHIAFLRQVLQHLSNRAILQIVPKLQRQFEYLALTEHLQSAAELRDNMDKPVERHLCGVALTAEPFNLSARETAVLCEVPSQGGIIQPTTYRLRQFPR